MPPHGKMKGKMGKAKKGTLSRLIKILFKNYKWGIIFSLACIMFNQIANLSSSFVLQKIVGNIETSIINQEFTWKETFLSMDPNKGVMFWLVYLGVVYLIGIGAAYLWNRNFAIITQKYLNTLRKQVFDHMETLPIKYFDTHPHGDIMSLYTNDIDTIRQLVSQSLPSIFQSAFSLIIVILFMLSSSIWLTLVILLGCVSMVIVTKILGGKSAKYFVKQQRSVGLAEGNIEEMINGLKVIKVFSHEDKSFDEFEKTNEELRANMTTANRASNTMMPILGNIGNFLYILVAIVGAALLVSNATNISLTGISPLSVAIILSFMPCTRMFTNNVNTFSQQITFIAMGLAGASRIFDIIDEKPETDEGYVELVHVKKDENGNLVETNERTRTYAWKHPHKADGTITYTPLNGDIVLDSVDFSYDPNGRQILFDVSVYARPGEKIALVGSTGAGKTTITNLINRFYDIQDGKIRYDGININKIKKGDLRRSLGIVLQDVNLFTGTVMENIRYGRLDASDEECIRAAKIANAHDFITRLPDGYSTMLSGSGSNLSQGQRQLLSIARAAVMDAPVLILDEATSSIDTRTERLVQEGMDKLMEGRTVFVIAHRLSTIQNSDAIMVMSQGKIIERGNHNSLIKEKGVYYQLYTGAFELE